MSPDGVRTVQRSWTVLDRHRDRMLPTLTAHLASRQATGVAPSERAEWLLGAVAALVGLLSSPSRLEAKACELGSTWPDRGAHPTFAGEGCAWMAAAAECSPHWTPAIDAAWRQAWLLLSDVLAAETLSPFSDECR